MAFSASARQVPGPAAGTVYALGDDATRIEVWPHVGFNCLRWQVRDAAGTWGDLLYVAPDFEANPVPTRSGHPVLFPFPNRLKFGRFDFAGRTWQLPLTESTKTHAIHGFSPRVPWRVVWVTYGPEYASFTCELKLSADVPGGVWPADFEFQVTYTLRPNRLTVDALVTNTDAKPLPFGLGYHPYFRLPTAPGATCDEFVLQVHAGTLWPALDSLATGDNVPVPADCDYRGPRRVGAAKLDHLFGSLPPTAGADGLREVAALGHVAAPGVVTVRADPGFREVLAFTPAHRQAVAIEPYTCATDAANLAARGIDSGWRVLAPGGAWEGRVEYVWDAGRRPVASGREVS